MNDERNKLIWNAVPTLFDIPNRPNRLASSRRQLVRTFVQNKAMRDIDVRRITLAALEHDHAYSQRMSSAVHSSGTLRVSMICCQIFVTS